jgi:hypothetical protein
VPQSEQTKSSPSAQSSGNPTSASQTTHTALAKTSTSSGFLLHLEILASMWEYVKFLVLPATWRKLVIIEKSGTTSIIISVNQETQIIFQDLF